MENNAITGLHISVLYSHQTLRRPGSVRSTMLATTLILALFMVLIAIVLLIALIAINLGLYLWEWLDQRRKSKVGNP